MASPSALDAERSPDVAEFLEVLRERRAYFGLRRFVHDGTSLEFLYAIA
jgi:hypothetical protein